MCPILSGDFPLQQRAGGTGPHLLTACLPQDAEKAGFRAQAVGSWDKTVKKKKKRQNNREFY